MAWDYIIVGAGSAGCVLANRLSAERSLNIGLVEAGGRDLSPYIHVPAAIIRAIGNPALDWCYSAQADGSRNGKVDLWPAGRTLGGSSSINGMLFVRGQPADFDRWAENGCTGWSYDEVLPYFKRLESTALGADTDRGRDGPQRVGPLRSTHPLAHIFVEAAKARGIPFNDDYNGRSQYGVAYSQVSQWRGQRFSAARAFLRPSRRRRNLDVMTRTVCRRIVWAQNRAVGVEVSRNGRIETLSARRGVIIAAGAIGSPKLLQLSGVGDGAELTRHRLPVVIDNTHVGRHLADHPTGMVGIDVNVSTYNTEINSWKIPLHVARWALTGRGPATSPYPHAIAFLKSAPTLAHPDIQVQLGPYAFSFSEDGVIPYDKPAISAAVNLSYPSNEGQVSLRSANPDDAPVIEHELLGSARDAERLADACGRVREIFADAAFDPYRVTERLPGTAVTSTADWVEYLRQSAFLGYHGVATCRMGAADTAVVDPSFAVHGAEHLHVVDASAMPGLISGNTNATVMMMAEKAADTLLSR